MSDNKLNLPAIKKSGSLVPTKKEKKFSSLDLSKETKMGVSREAMSSIQQKQNRGMDLVLVGDLTGSMIKYHDLLKDKFLELSVQLFKMINNLKIGIIFYLDHGSGDPYVTKVSPLTRNEQDLIQFINVTETGDGGDTDEAVEDALNDIGKLNWRDGHAHSVVIFGDASPHEPSQCPYQHSYFDITQKLYKKNIVINSVFCGSLAYTNEVLQQLEDVPVGNFDKKIVRPNPEEFFSWIANVTGGMIIGVENISDLLDIIMATAAKDSGHLEELEKHYKLNAPEKLKLINIAKKSTKRQQKFLKDERKLLE